jgi:flagellar capping protein FliD
MTDSQLYFSVGIPTLAVFVSMLVNGYWSQALNARMSTLETTLSARMAALDQRIAAIEQRMSNLESRVYAQLEMLTGKIADMDTRLSVLEDRLKR